MTPMHGIVTEPRVMTQEGHDSGTLAPEWNVVIGVLQNQGLTPMRSLLLGFGGLVFLLTAGASAAPVVVQPAQTQASASIVDVADHHHHWHHRRWEHGHWRYWD